MISHIIVLASVVIHPDSLPRLHISSQQLLNHFNKCIISPTCLHKDKLCICHTWFRSAIWRVIIQPSSMLDNLKAVQQARTNFNSCWSHNYTTQRLFRKVAGTNIVNRCETVHMKEAVHLSTSKDFIPYLYSRSLPSRDNRSEL
jgi:hypothetical protein